MILVTRFCGRRLRPPSERVLQTQLQLMLAILECHLSEGRIGRGHV
jgi:hypothetical protein